MASEKDRWWCHSCKCYLPDGPIPAEHCQHDIWCIPAAALDAHTAEVVRRCVQECELQELLATTLGSSYKAGWEDARKAITQEIRALAPRKEDV